MYVEIYIGGHGKCTKLVVLVNEIIYMLTFGWLIACMLKKIFFFREVFSVSRNKKHYFFKIFFYMCTVPLSIIYSRDCASTSLMVLSMPFIICKDFFSYFSITLILHVSVVLSCASFCQRDRHADDYNFILLGRCFNGEMKDS